MFHYTQNPKNSEDYRSVLPDTTRMQGVRFELTDRLTDRISQVAFLSFAFWVSHSN